MPRLIKASSAFLVGGGKVVGQQELSREIKEAMAYKNNLS
jgi:hypothetical protein